MSATHTLFVCLAASVLSLARTGRADEQQSDMVRIPGGNYRPLLRSGSELKIVPVKTFCLDVLPVTQGDYLEFVRANPRWRRSQVKRLFADESYLQNWMGDLEPGTNAPVKTPVSCVSWFAAKAYAQWKGKRLPTLAEWEYAASASPTRADGESDPAFRNEILQWYTTPTSASLRPAGAGRANLWGVRDLHGLVWEWVSDFNTAMVRCVRCWSGRNSCICWLDMRPASALPSP